MTEDHRQHRVTVVDDAPELLSLFGDALGFDGIQVTLLPSPNLQKIESSDPDLMVVDLRLGADGLSGLDLIRLIRSHRELRHVPIIACSAALEEIDRSEEELNGMPDLYVLRKPFSLEDLEACVDDALGIDTRRLAAAE